MSDPTTADEVAAAFAEAQGDIYDAFLPDTYELLSVGVPTQDEFGGWTTTDVVVESEDVGDVPFPYRGRCLLDVAGRIGTEGGIEVTTATGPFIADLPVQTVATSDHRIRITSAEIGETRTFDIVSEPKRGGGFEVFTRLELELRSRDDE